MPRNNPTNFKLESIQIHVETTLSWHQCPPDLDSDYIQEYDNGPLKYYGSLLRERVEQSGEQIVILHRNYDKHKSSSWVRSDRGKRNSTPT